MSIKPNFVTYREKIKIFLYSGSFVTGKIYFSPLDIQWDCGTSILQDFSLWVKVCKGILRKTVGSHV